MTGSNSGRAIMFTFRKNTPGKKYEPPYPPSYELNSTTIVHLEK